MAGERLELRTWKRSVSREGKREINRISGVQFFSLSSLLLRFLFTENCFKGGFSTDSLVWAYGDGSGAKDESEQRYFPIIGE